MKMKFKVEIPDLQADFDRRLEKGYEYIRNKALWDMEPIMPRKTGNFIMQTQAENAAWGNKKEIIVGASVPYNWRLWWGHHNGIPFHWTNPMTEAQWGEVAYERYGDMWAQGIAEEMMRDE